MKKKQPRPLQKAPKAYHNPDFINSPPARSLRILAEYVSPEKHFESAHINNTVIFFGSARIPSPESYEQEHSKLVEKVAKADGEEKEVLQKSLAGLERRKKYVRYYEDAVELARLITEWSMQFPPEKRFVVCSGGGPGIMEASNRGAYESGGESIGLNISLPFEQAPNPYITPYLNFEFHYFFMRKYWFMYYAKGLIVFPGGFGTLDEMMELLTLVQTKKIQKPMPILLYGEEFWSSIINFDALVESGMVSADDLNLFHFVNTPEEAFALLTRELARLHEL